MSPDVGPPFEAARHPVLQPSKRVDTELDIRSLRTACGRIVLFVGFDLKLRPGDDCWGHRDYRSTPCAAT
jgi:hypothetical protein